MSYAGFVNAGLQIGLQSILIRPTRGLYGIVLPDGSQMEDIVAQATVEERHVDQMEITDHPVEQGASISDHAFKRPAELILQLGWSNSPSQSSSLLNAAIGAAAASNQAARQVANAVGIFQGVQSFFTGSGTSQVEAIYRNLLKLQESRALFVVYTGKRVYTNMLCQTLATETTQRTENSLPITMVCRQVILVNTQTVTLPKTTQANPSETASPVDKGTQNLRQVQ